MLIPFQNVSTSPTEYVVLAEDPFPTEKLRLALTVLIGGYAFTTTDIATP
jgi:hypothetical protein